MEKQKSTKSKSQNNRKRKQKTENEVDQADLETCCSSQSNKKMKVTRLTPPNPSPKCVGGHVSIQKSFIGAVEEAIQIGAKSFALFTGSQRSWTRKPITNEAAADFIKACKENDFPPHRILPHGSYLINLGSIDQEKLQKSKQGFIDELQRCEQLGLVLYNFHPGACVGCDSDSDVEKSLISVANCINEAHAKTKSIITVLENTAGQGSSLGHNFEQLRKVIDHIKDKNRVGVCLDTCHMFAAGYDLRTKESCTKVFQEFDDIIGFKYLKGMHLNDSKKELNCRVDRHENIGKGMIGLECFRTIMNDSRFDDIPLILETAGPYDKEIQLLYSLEDKK